MSWYKNAFGEDYLKIYSHRDDLEARQFLRRIMAHLQVPRGARILDLCCGAGRHAMDCAGEGYQVVGVDLSPALLNLAHERAVNHKLAIHWIQGDMRAVPLRGAFDLVLNMFTSFGYFQEDSDNFHVIENMQHVLRRGGHAVLDFLNPEHVIATLVPHETHTTDGLTVTQSRALDPEGKRVLKEIRITGDGEPREYQESVRLYQKEELDSMFQEAGFRTVELYRNYYLEPWTPETPRTILVAQKIK